ncbi:MAG: hypothetical protein OXH84_04430 [Gammaproteobacteria bacterium]|nr:hypothetical protein [Gammaproteobacteria bacterium]
MTQKLTIAMIILLGEIFLSVQVQSHVLESNTSFIHAESDTDAEYHKHEILGFTVHILVEDVEDQPELAEQMLWYVRGQLQNLVNVLPSDKLKLLQTVEIWVNDDYDEDDELCGIACYVPERYRGVDFFEDRAGAVIIRDFEILLDSSWCCTFSTMIHEMAHAFHDQFIEDGFNNDFIEETYDDAVDSGDFENNKVMYPWWDEQRRDHYGMTDEYEFFATMSQTYFLWYWVYPYNVRDLYEDFYDAYRMVVNSWFGDVEDGEVDPSSTQNLPADILQPEVILP